MERQQLRFTKMEGLGNDYVYVDCTKTMLEEPEKIAVKVSDRHFGIGSDGLILICPSKKADFEMRMYNADGSRSEMCGNGIRCVGKYVYDYGLTDKTQLKIETLAGVKHLSLDVCEGHVQTVTVDMGKPIFRAKDIPVCIQNGAEDAIDVPIVVGDRTYNVTCISMGNPHSVVFLGDTEELQTFELSSVGPLFEKHPAFPNRVNAEFVKVIDRHTVEMRVWERGSGETLACGTGACAVAVASIVNGWTGDEVEVHLLGGHLHIRWDRKLNKVYMTGPANVVFDGIWNAQL